MNRTQGFTLAELMITLALVAILASVAAPSFSEFIANNRITSQANQLVATLNLARSEAIKRNVRVTVCRSDTGTSCSGTWNDGWVVFVDGGTAGTVDGTDTILRTSGGFGAGTTLTAVAAGTATPTNSVQFQRLGLTTTVDFTLTASNCTGQNKRLIGVSASGRIQTQKASCT